MVTFIYLFRLPGRFINDVVVVLPVFLRLILFTCFHKVWLSHLNSLCCSWLMF